MPIRTQRLGRGVSMPEAENSWASQVLASSTTNIKDMARFQQRQLLEKEQKLLQLYDQQQLRAHQVAQRGSAGSNGSNSSGNGTSSTVSHHQTVTRTTTSTHSNSNSPAGGKVRQMFDERRQTTVKGIDKSYPLEPLDNRSRKQQSTTTTSNIVTSSTSPLKNGNPMSNRQSLVVRRTVRSEANSNVNGGKPIVSYHEEVSRESCGSTERDNELEEFGDDDNRDSRYANGNRQVDERSEVHIEDVTNENTTQRHRTTAKIHLGEYDGGNEANRVGDDLENEQFPEDFVMDAPDRLPRRAPPPKKPSQAEARLERFKNSNPKRPGQIAKQVAGNTTSFTKKRTETSVHSGSTSRASTVTRTELEEEETSTRATTPEVERTGRPRSSTPEERARKLTHPVVDRTSTVARSSGVSKVSQLTHKNSMDFYPRRKSEFEKSKTFRKLQLELGESSPEPAEPEEEASPVPPKPGKKRSSILDDDVYSPGRRSSSSSPIRESPIYVGKTSETREENESSSAYFSRRKSSTSSLTTDRQTLEERRTSREMSPDRPSSRKRSESPIDPVYERKSTVKREETRTADGGRHSTSVESNFYSSRRRSSSTRPTDDSCPAKGRRVSREKSPERPQPRKASESPIYGRKSVADEEIKTAGRKSSVYLSERRSSSASPTPAHDSPRERRRDSQEMSPDRPESRRQSESPINPIYERKSTVKREETRTVDGGRRSTTVESNFYSTRRRSSTNRPTSVASPVKGRRTSREKSPERPQSRKGSESPAYGRKTAVRKEEIRTTSSGIRTTGRESDVYTSRRRSSSSGPTTIHDPQKERRNSREMTPERPQSRRGSESPVCGRKSSLKTIDHMSSIYSSERRSSSSSPAPGQRRHSREMTPERPQSRRRSESPVYGRKSSLRNEENKTTSSRFETTGQMSSIYSSERRSSSSSPAPGQRRHSREMSPERPQSRRGSESPVYGRKSSLRTEENKTTSSRFETTGQVSSIYSSERRSSSSSPVPGQRRHSREMSPERPQSRRGSESPVYGRKSSLRNEEKSTNVETKTTGLQSNVYDSRRRFSSTTPTTTHDPQTGRPNSREMSPDRPASRGGSASPVHQRRSIVTSEETRTTRAGGKATRTERRVTSEDSTVRSESPTCVRMTRKRSESPRRDFRGPSADREDFRVNVNSHRTSGGTLRSVELVKKLARPGGTDRKMTTSARQSSERKTTLEDVELQRPKSRSKSPPHRVVKKDRAVMGDDKSRTNENARRNSNEPTTKPSRSRTTSPSPPPPSTMRETASFRAKKAERKDSSELRAIDTRHRYHQEDRKVHEISKTNLSHEKARTCDLTSAIRSSSPEGKEGQSRRSSTETAVKRHDTFKVKKPSERIMKIERESSVDDDDMLPIDKPIRAEARDQSDLLERIEKIRTTLSKSGRSEQNLHEAKDFERTDSVESALRRFDSIGVETEHHVTVGVDDVDRTSACASPEPVRRRSTKEIVGQEGKATKKSVETRSKSAKITVAVAKTQPRGVEPKARESSKEKQVRVSPRQRISETTKSVRAKKEKSATATTPRESAKQRVSQKIATSLVRKSELRGEESSGRGEGRIGSRSPECKRRLFDDSESEIDTDNSRSTVVLSAITTVTKGPGLFEIEARNNRDNLKIGSEKTIRSESSIREVRAEQEPTRILRSIEDIRKSIKRESQDFKRELNKFNTAMRKDEEMSSSVSSSVSPDEIVTSGIVSCVKITKTLNPGDVEPVVKIERSTVKLPITHRIAKSPSPDIGTRRSTEGRARTPTASVRRSVPSSPAKSPDAAARYGSADFKSAGPRPLVRGSPSPSSARENRIRTETSRTTEYTDCTDGPADLSELTITETVTTTSTKRNDAFVVELDDDDVPRGKDSASSSQGKPPPRKQSAEKSLTSQKPQRSPNTTPLPRPASALSTSSTGSARGQSAQINSKSKMSTKTKTPPAPNGPKRPSESARASTAAAVNDGLSPCKICGRRFNSDRISLHEQICSKTATKKRKQFDATIHRVKGTELESFVVKKGAAKKGPADRKTSKPEVKSNWRRKHEDFINAIRSAKQVQAHLAAGGKLSDLPPPPPSDTSDYVQCPHCGRKFNQGAADRHIPKCQNMMHNKPNPRAPPKPKR